MTRVTTLALGSLILFAGPSAHAEGLDVSPYRLALDRGGLGTVEGADAPPLGTFDVAAGTDLAVRPLVLRGAGSSQDVVAARWSVEPALTLGLGAAFAVHVRAPFVVDDVPGERGTLPAGVQLAGPGARSPSLGLLVPITMIGEGHLVARAEATLPVGAPNALRGDGAPSGRLGLVHADLAGRIRWTLAAGGELAQVSTLGDVKRGSAARVGLAGRFPSDAAVAAVASLDARADLSATVRPTGLVAGGVDALLGRSHVEALGGLGLNDVVGTPRVWFGLSLQTDVAPFVPIRRSPEPDPLPAAPAPPTVARAPPVPQPAAVPVVAAAPPAVFHAPATPPALFTQLLPAAPAKTRLVAIPVPTPLFETGSAVLDLDAVRGLVVLAARVLAAGEPIQMQIIGHADRRPHTATNHALGLERARAVAWLLVDLGIPGSWLRVTSEGALRPARGVEKTDDDRLRDRRVEIVLGGETSPVEEVSLVVP